MTGAPPSSAVTRSSTILDPAGERTLRILKPVVMDESDVESASEVASQPGQKAIQFKLTAPGSKKFAVLTSKNVGRQLAIIWNGRVLTAPVVHAPITAGIGEICARLSDAETQQLLDVLNHRAANRGTQ